MIIVHCNLDGTSTTNNSTLLLRERYAIGEW